MRGGDGDPDPLFRLAAAANGGDARAMRRLIEAVIAGIRPTIRLVLGNEYVDLPDVEQECLIALRDSLPRFRGESSLMQFARRLALRRALTARARWRLRERLVRKVQERRWELSETGADDDPLILAHRALVVRHLLHALPPVQAQALTMRVLQGLSLGQIARATRSPANTVRSRVRLAKARLRQRILGQPAIHELLIDGKDS